MAMRWRKPAAWEITNSPPILTKSFDYVKLLMYGEGGSAKLLLT
jgi:hypothetical protein